MALARGPLIYCLEDADHLWVDDDFKSLCLPASSSSSGYENKLLSSLTEKGKCDLPLDEPYFGITAPKAGYFMNTSHTKTNITDEGDGRPSRNLLEYPLWKSLVDRNRESVDLHFIPYFARANRGGKGMMRVGIKVV